ncbi:MULTISPECIES: DUF4198 domain-containing protein [Hydrogenophaga]|uniref:Putative signal peptide protein n=1 Tax=Hydrogenophaga intermedia TaxID=65786 RepID=A0A1L1PJJ6_HYDIT|nr:MULTISPECIES: DUF4198 domain-containing protein [Hydrogenophaga]AOS78958.1 ABC transporter permease [Hydrogenophaga sp. PBC]TMU74487.1 DUF4198 domain-containing protein [Hydrogenophaga intermedia]CDN87929.1 Putative signal peptide protein [Hydrogenophaga intermedia]
MKNVSLRARTLALAAALALPMAAHAHRAWLLPSGTVYSGQQPWVSVDAAISNDIFYYEHNAAGLDNLVVVGPNGQPVQAENQAKGRYRSMFDVKLEQQGTYRIALVNDGMIASFKVGNETKRLRGNAESLAKEIPAGATDLRVSQNNSRVETFVTRGKPSTDALKPTGKGIELVAVTHPNDLVEGDTATFRFLDNGKPAAGYSATVILGGLRYRSELGEMRMDTDANGEIKVKWPAAGMYWVNVAPPRPPRVEGAPPAPPTGPAGTLAEPVRRSNYSLTLEVLPN